MSTKLIMGVTAGLLVLATLQSPTAEAKGKGKHISHAHKHHVHKWHKWRVVPYQFVNFDGCGAYYWKWKNYGGAYWKEKYFGCADIY